MTQHPDLFAALAAPFEPSEIKIRNQNGRQLHYITARTAMNRLDTVLGPENWSDEFVSFESTVVCRLTIRLPDGMTVTKCDAGGYAGMQDAGDDEKSAFSDAFKRACAKFGVARYLYRDGVPAFVSQRAPGVEHPLPEPVSSPSSAPSAHASSPRPAESATAPAPAGTSAATAPSQRPSPPASNAPRHGRALFAWLKEQEQRYEVGLLKYLNSWAKLQEFPGRMVDWDADQVSLAHAEACRKLQALESGRSEAYEEALAN
jgi:hypothetical protein